MFPSQVVLFYGRKYDEKGTQKFFVFHYNLLQIFPKLTHYKVFEWVKFGGSIFRVVVSATLKTVKKWFQDSETK